jgi:hypothetical protein
MALIRPWFSVSNVKTEGKRRRDSGGKRRNGFAARASSAEHAGVVETLGRRRSIDGVSLAARKT